MTHNSWRQFLYVHKAMLFNLSTPPPMSHNPTLSLEYNNNRTLPCILSSHHAYHIASRSHSLTPLTLCCSSLSLGSVDGLRVKRPRRAPPLLKDSLTNNMYPISDYRGVQADPWRDMNGPTLAANGVELKPID